MATTTSTSNPTGLKQIDKVDISLTVNRSGDERYVALTDMDLAAYKLPKDCAVILIARAGNTAQRFELGSVANWDKGPKLLEALDPSASLKFRVVFHLPGSPQLVAACENIRPRAEGELESLIVMEPVELGEEVWKFEIQAGDEPVLLINRDVFSTSAAAAEHKIFTALVLPEVFRQICSFLAQNPDILTEDDHPMHEWGAWFDAAGFERPPTDADLMEPWVDEVVKKFSLSQRYASTLKKCLEVAADD